MSSVRANNYYDASGGSNAQLYGVASPPNSMGFRNRIINGDMRIDQRNAGASVTPADGAYTLDRWSVYQFVASKFSVQQNAGAVTPPTGFSNYLGVTSLSAYTVLSGGANTVQQAIEGFNTADLAWGTANAQAVTLSFWVRSSLTGTFGGAVQNSAANRSYPFSFTVSAASTWEYKTITIPGDTTGTWVGATNGVGLRVFFGLGVGSTYSGTAGAWAGSQLFSATGAVSVVGTNGATFYITGVQLEAGTVASPFERRDYGRELMMCQRYFTQIGAGLVGTSPSANNIAFGLQFPVRMRAAATVTLNGNSSTVRWGGTDQTATSPAIQFGTITDSGGLIDINGFSATVSGGNLCAVERNGVNFFNASAEL